MAAVPCRAWRAGGDRADGWPAGCRHRDSAVIGAGPACLASAGGAGRAHCRRRRGDRRPAAGLARRPGGAGGVGATASARCPAGPPAGRHHRACGSEPAAHPWPHAGRGDQPRGGHLRADAADGSDVRLPRRAGGLAARRRRRGSGTRSRLRRGRRDGRAWRAGSGRRGIPRNLRAGGRACRHPGLWLAGVGARQACRDRGRHHRADRLADRRRSRPCWPPRDSPASCLARSTRSRRPPPSPVCLSRRLPRCCPPRRCAGCRPRSCSRRSSGGRPGQPRWVRGRSCRSPSTKISTRSL